MHDEERGGRPTVTTECLMQKVVQILEKNRRLTITSLFNYFLQVSRSVPGEIVT